METTSIADIVAQAIAWTILVGGGLIVIKFFVQALVAYYKSKYLKK